MANLWGKQELEFLRYEVERAVRNGYEWSHIADRLAARTGRKLTPAGLRQTASRHGISKQTVARKEVKELPPPIDLQELEEEAEYDTIRSLQSQLRNATKTNIKLKQLKGDMLKVMGESLSTIHPPKISFKKERNRKDSYEEIAWLHLTDMQIGRRVDLGMTAGITEYNFEIFQERMERLVYRFLKIVKEQRTDRRKIKRCIIALGGDIVDGEDIFPGHAFVIDLSAFRQVTEGVHVLAQAISEISKHFEQVDIICVDGNHGRPGKKGQHSPHTNFDRIFYYMLSLLMKDHKNINISIAEGHMAILDVFGYTFLMSHGDEYRGSLGIPVYGQRRAAHHYMSMTRLAIDVFLHGHHHNPADFDVAFSESIAVGSFQGGSIFSVKNMQTACQPSQLCFFIHPQHRITSKWKITLEELPKMTADKHGFYTPMARNPGQ